MTSFVDIERQESIAIVDAPLPSLLVKGLEAALEPAKPLQTDRGISNRLIANISLLYVSAVAGSVMGCSMFENPVLGAILGYVTGALAPAPITALSFRRYSSLE